MLSVDDSDPSKDLDGFVDPAARVQPPAGLVNEAEVMLRVIDIVFVTKDTWRHEKSSIEESPNGESPNQKSPNGESPNQKSQNLKIGI